MKDGELFIQVWLPALKKGVLAQLGKTNWHTFSALMEFIDKGNKCYPPEKLLAKRLGLSDETVVSKRIKRLEKATFDGKPVIKVENKGRIRGEDGKLKWTPNIYALSGEIVSIFRGKSSDWQNGQTENRVKKFNREVTVTAIDKNSFGWRSRQLQRGQTNDSYLLNKETKGGSGKLMKCSKCGEVKYVKGFTKLISDYVCSNCQEQGISLTSR